MEAIILLLIFAAAVASFALWKSGRAKSKGSGHAQDNPNTDKK